MQPERRSSTRGCSAVGPRAGTQSRRRTDMQRGGPPARVGKGSSRCVARPGAPTAARRRLPRRPPFCAPPIYALADAPDTRPPARQRGRARAMVVWHPTRSGRAGPPWRRPWRPPPAPVHLGGSLPLGCLWALQCLGSGPRSLPRLGAGNGFSSTGREGQRAPLQAATRPFRRGPPKACAATPDTKAVTRPFKASAVACHWAVAPPRRRWPLPPPPREGLWPPDHVPPLHAPVVPPPTLPQLPVVLPLPLQ